MSWGKIGGAVVLMFAAACQSEPQPQSNELAQANGAVERVVASLVDSFHAADTARNAQGVIDLLWPEYSMLADGQWMEYDDIVAGSRTFMESLEVFDTQWTDLRITRVGPDAVVSAFIFSDSIVARDGTVTRSRGPTTFVWQRRGDEWRVLFADADHYPRQP